MEIDPVVLQVIGRQTLTIEILTGQIRRLKAEARAKAESEALSASNEDAEG